MKARLCGTLLIALMLFGLTGCSGWTNKTEGQAAGNVSVLVINVGRADSILVRLAGKNYLIDTGEKESAPQLIRALNLFGVRSLDGVFLTHTHSDHIGGMETLAQNFRIKTLYTAAISEPNKDGGSEMDDLAAEFSLAHQKLNAGDKVLIAGDVSFEVLGPLVYNGEDDNDNSLVLKLSANGKTMLLTGDMQFAEEQSLMDAGIDLSADILKVANHGNADATSDAFASAVSPEYALISTDTAEDSNSANARVRSALSGANLFITQNYECGILLSVHKDGSVEITDPKIPRQSADMAITNIDRDAQTVTIQNNGGRADLSGFFLFSDKGGEAFVFPEGSRLGAGESATVSCTKGAGDYFWKGEDKVWKKDDTGILYDRYGNELSAYNE